MSYITDAMGANFSLFKVDVDPGDAINVGQRFHTADGREVALFQNGAVALTAGVLTQSSAFVANHQNLTTVSYAPVSTQTNLPANAVITLGATAATVGQYANGFAIVNAGTGIGQTLKITNNTAGASSGNITVTFEDAPTVALDATSKISLIANPYLNVIIAPTTFTGTVTGVTLYPVAAAGFGFLVTKGIVSCLSDATVAAIGLAVARSATTAGAITVGTATSADVGRAYIASVSAQANPIWVQI